MISYLNDHKRFIPGLTIYNPTAQHAAELLEKTVSRQGQREQTLTGRGLQFYLVRGGI